MNDYIKLPARQSGKSYTQLKEFLKEYNCIYTDKTGIYFKDGVGGIHGDGIGYNPNGIFCGECSRLSCKSCVNKDSKDDGGEN